MSYYDTPIFIDNPPTERCCMTEAPYDPSKLYFDRETDMYILKDKEVLEKYLDWQCEEQGIDAVEEREIYELQIINNK